MNKAFDGFTSTTDSTVGSTRSTPYVPAVEPMWPAFGQFKPRNLRKAGATYRKPKGYVRDQNGSWRRKDLLGMK